MDVVADLDAECPPDRLREWIRDLDRYPSWLSIVPRAELEPSADGADVGEEAWSVELRAKVGPLARSKRLRMVRTVDELDHVRFERAELDGKQHSPWVLDARIAPTEKGSRVTMTLHYGGRLGGGVVERLLGDEIEASRPRLRALVEGAD
ncbi:MAG TPA: SRPBCC family protein [Acidimicrobiales bacterium]